MHAAYVEPKLKSANNNKHIGEADYCRPSCICLISTKPHLPCLKLRLREEGTQQLAALLPCITMVPIST
jgi:hypothetical protein